MNKMGRDKIKIYLVDHNLGISGQDEFGVKNLETLAKILSAKGYSVISEDVLASLSSEFDLILLHLANMKKWNMAVYDFQKNYPEIPIVCLSRINKNQCLESDDCYREKLKEYLNFRDNDGNYDCDPIVIKPFLKFIKYLTGKIPRFNTNI